MADTGRLNINKTRGTIASVSIGFVFLFISISITLPAQELHTNFRISGAGEYLGLFDPDGIGRSEFDPWFPVQQTDISYGFYDGTYMGFRIPTPGQANNPSNTIIPLTEPSRGYPLQWGPYKQR